MTGYCTVSNHDKLREAIRVYRDRIASGAYNNAEFLAQSNLIAAAAESTLPKTRMVEVWRIEWAARHHVTGDWLAYCQCWSTKDGAEGFADRRAAEGASCIRVTGPHMQEVPA